MAWSRCWSAAHSSSLSLPDETVGAIVGLAGGVLPLLGLWLFATGLPRWRGSAAFAEDRRRRWITLLVVGFVVMLAAAVALFEVDVRLGVLVGLAYWFVWTWAAWLIADHRAMRALVTDTEIENT